MISGLFKNIFFQLVFIGISFSVNAGNSFASKNLYPPITLRMFSMYMIPTPNEQLSTNTIEDKAPLYFKYAIFLDIPVELVTNLYLFHFISEWHGTRYHFGGTSKKGIDCSAFVQRLMNDVYCISLERMAGMQFEQCREINKNELEQGDLVFFQTTRAGLSHVGFYLGDNKFVHASVNRGISVDDLNDAYYKKAYRKSGRVLHN